MRFWRRPRQNSATARAREVTEREAAFTVQAFRATMHYRELPDVEHLCEGLLKAGCLHRPHPFG
jgi:hypothetical protein